LTDQAQPETPHGPPSSDSQTFSVTRFGSAEPLEVSSGDTLTFSDGLVGLDHLRAFTLVEDERVTPCRWLQSLDEPALAFLVVDPGLVDPAYAPELPEGDRWVIITLRVQPERSTANLLAPVVIDGASRTGQQIVLHDSGYSLRHPITTLSTSLTDQSP
jgi:flagellar assembly factor FliW